MNRLILTLLMCLAASGAFAQIADIKVTYGYNHHDPTGKAVNSKMVLLADRNQSKFFSIVNEQVDSMMTTAEGRMAYSQMVQAAMEKRDVANLPIKKEPMYVLKSTKDSVTSVYDLVGADFWVYDEPLIAQQWEITDSTKKILDYECVKATCNFRGRNWAVWFTPEIPLQDGPWKLCGLPGLILSAEDLTGQYSFIADGVQNTSEIIRPIFGKENYEKTDRIKYLQSTRSFTDNALEYIRAATGSNVADMPRIEIDESYDFLETDYRK
ncbi:MULTISPECIES: GLPGLI family protein [Duncaniella]|uniref:GLPGLI family protein n=1 Tax=Duncaniella dubosii TaxID=2518971 RepID=A0A4P7W062_9BACT|nr:MULTISPECIES: GLPGLI family protein [Duncaniella]MBJ2190942.1 GLPGLI family protein [Muribaculaceae bacterium]QCD41102.1 GLPGLI family protein [Duncaniella dubosii]HBN63365.1 hypothetical protein [Porphyromonadaceae bacterium]